MFDKLKELVNKFEEFHNHTVWWNVTLLALMMFGLAIVVKTGDKWYWISMFSIAIYDIMNKLVKLLENYIASKG